MTTGWGLIALLTVFQPEDASGTPMQGQEQRVETIAAKQKAVFRRYVSIWESGTVEHLSTVLAPNYLGHASSGDRGVEGLRDRIIKFRKLYPDVRFIIEDQVAEGDRVSTCMTTTATSSVTGKSVKLIGLNISRFVDARIAEEWPVWETAP